MKWSEFIETKKSQLTVALLLVMVLVGACVARACSRNQSGQNAVDTFPEGAYLATVTYVVNFPSTGEEPIIFVQQVAPNGKPIQIPEIADTDDLIWSGWYTEEGEPFNFDAVVTKDCTVSCYYYEDQNNNNIADGTGSDPITIYCFLNLNGSVMFEQKLFGLNAELDYTTPDYSFPQGENDGYVFLGWNEERTVSENGGVMTVTLKPSLAADRNNNDLVDGSDEDPYTYHVFLDQEGNVIQEILWLDGEEPVKTEDVACPTTSQQKLTGWERTEFINEYGEQVYTYFPQIVG